MYFATCLVPEFQYYPFEVFVKLSFGSLKQACLGSTADLQFYPQLSFCFASLQFGYLIRCISQQSSRVVVSSCIQWYPKSDDLTPVDLHHESLTIQPPIKINRMVIDNFVSCFRVTMASLVILCRRQTVLLIRQKKLLFPVRLSTLLSMHQVFQ